MKAEICPVCESEGTVLINGFEKICHGCNGYGWVEVKENEKQYHCPSKEQMFGPIQELREKFPPFTYFPPARDEYWSDWSNNFTDPNKIFLTQN